MKMPDSRVDSSGASGVEDRFRVARVAAPLRQQVTASIRDAIAVGRFRPGDRLTERDLCAMTGVSRTLVREAIRQLESEGLVSVVPNRGPVVTPLSRAQAEGIYQVRRELEGLAAELFARHASEAHQQALRESLRHLPGALDDPDPLVRIRAKNAFYEVLIRGAGNEALGLALSLLNVRITLLRSMSLSARGRASKSAEELEALVEALVARDARKARAAAQKHVSNAARTALECMDAYNDDAE